MIFLNKHAHLVLKTPSAMVFFLRVDITEQRAEIGRSDRKQPVSPLPRELRNSLLFHPCRRRRFDLGDNSRCVIRRCKSDHQMNMIGRSAYPKTLTAQFTGSAHKIGMKLSFTSLRDQRSPILGAEDNVNQVEAQSLRHSADYMPGLQPFGSFPIRQLGLRPRLVCRRAFGPYSEPSLSAVPEEVHV
jgi:hypothetical protein